MSMEIVEYGIAPPATDDANFIWIDAAKQESHCAAGSKRASSDIFWIDAGMHWYGEVCRQRRLVIIAEKTARRRPASS